MDVYLIRHAEPDIGAGRCYGRLDLPPKPNLESAAQRLLPFLPSQGLVLCCAAQRCRQLALQLAAGRGARTSVDERLQELDFGQWEGREWTEIPRVQTDLWARDVWNRSPPDGETYAALWTRVNAAWDAMLALPEDVILVVGSAGPLRALVTIALELPPEAFIRLHMDYGGVSRLSDAGGGWRLDFTNR